MNANNKYLNEKEHEILYTILHAEEPLTVAQIIKHHPEMTANIVQPAIRKLLKLGLIEVADIVMDRNIFSRSFQPASGSSDIIRRMFMDEYIRFSRLVSGQTLLSAMIQADDNPDTAQQEISELEQLLEEYKKKI